MRIQRETDLTAVSHLTCVCHSQEELGAILDRYAASGIENILALGGDPPQNLANYDRSRDAFQFAEQLYATSARRRVLPTREASGSAWPGFPRDIPALPTDCWKSIISAQG